MRPTLELAVLAGVAVASIGSASWILLKSRRDPSERERRRRALISGKGRFIEGVVTDCHDGIVYYSYSWRGVDYEASQDLNSLAALVPDSPDLLIGLATVKFLPGDPANSIVFSETWSGFPRHRLAPTRQ